MPQLSAPEATRANPRPAAPSSKETRKDKEEGTHIGRGRQKRKLKKIYGERKGNRERCRGNREYRNVEIRRDRVDERDG